MYYNSNLRHNFPDALKSLIAEKLKLEANESQACHALLFQADGFDIVSHVICQRAFELSLYVSQVKIFLSYLYTLWKGHLTGAELAINTKKLSRQDTSPTNNGHVSPSPPKEQGRALDPSPISTWWICPC